MNLQTYSWPYQILPATVEVLEKEAEKYIVLSASPFLLFSFFSFLDSIAFVWNISRMLFLAFPDETLVSRIPGLTDA